MHTQQRLNLTGQDDLLAKFTGHSVKREALTFLGHVPRASLVHGPGYFADLCLNVGNFLCFTSPHFDGMAGVEFADVRLGEEPKSIGAVGQQFQHVGRHFIENQTPPQIALRVEYLQSRVDELERLLYVKIAEGAQ